MSGRTLAEMWWDAGPEEITVSVWKYSRTASIWAYSITNHVGGSSGSSNRGTQGAALSLALQHMPLGTEYRLKVNGQDRGLRVRGAEVSK